MSRPALTILPILLGAALARGAPAEVEHTPTLPPGFAQRVVADGITGATAMAVAPDGRVFVCEQTGTLRVVDEGKLLSDPVLRLDVDSYWERGLIGVTLDPRFASNGFLYVVYVSPKPFPHHVVSRFTLRGNASDPGSEKVLLEGDEQTKMGGTIPAGHQGGGIRFGKDGRLYITIGEQTAGEPSQRLDTLLGKLLRINLDGSIPQDNPFVAMARGKYRAIYAYGLRNPFALAVQPGTGRIFIDDVGESRWEEINEAVKGANYGWPLSEGPTTDPRFKSPLYAYAESPQQSITGGVFYNPDKPQFPESFSGKYLFADFMYHTIRVLDPADPWTSAPFASGLSGPVALDLAPDGSLYVLERNAWVKDEQFKPKTGRLRRVFHVEGSGVPAPQVVKWAAEIAAVVGQPVTFRAEAKGQPPLRYDWLENGRWVGGGADSDYARTPAATDDGLRVQCVVSNALGSVKTPAAMLSVATLREPMPAPPGRVPGLRFRYVEGAFGRMPAFDREPVTRSGTSTSLDLAPRARDDHFGLSYSGFLQVDRDGLYSFTVASSGACKLFVASTQVVSIGLSGGPRNATGAVALKAGLHPLGLDFYHGQGNPSLSVSYAGPAVAEQPVPAAKLWNDPATEPGGGAANGNRRLATTVDVPPVVGNQPRLLSETGLFRSLDTLEPEAGVIAYSVNVPQWADGATVRRWIVLPGDARVRFSEQGPWQFPAGTVLVQHLEYADRRMETRVLVLDRGGRATASTYVWTPDQHDARLTIGGAKIPLPHPGTAATGSASSRWVVPSADDCKVCHSPLAGVALGVSTRQLNRPADNGTTGTTENQLMAWGRHGLLAQPIDPATLPKLGKLAPLTDDAAPLQLRVRSYLDANCAQCHRPGGVRAGFDARFETPPDRQRLVGTKPLASDLGIHDALLVAPGHRERSMVYQRMSRRQDVFNMPPLGSQVPDRQALDVLGRWIDSLDHGRK